MILITEATGHVGRGVVTELCEAGVPVRVMSFVPSPAGLPEDTEVILADPSDLATSLPAAVKGVDAVFLVLPDPAADAAPAVLEAIGNHTRRIVYLSSESVQEAGDQDVPLTAAHAAMERAVEGSGLEWTFLRPTGFAADDLRWADQIREYDIVRAPFGDVSRPLIHEWDIAAVAARALVEKGHVGQKYVLTGPRSLTTREQVATIARAIGRPLDYEEIPADITRKTKDAAEQSGEPVDGTLAALAHSSREPEPVNRVVEEITGVPARSFREWAADHAADFRR
jgi:uncharacterized protein YbjT (DUF2867 family)